ncbi:glycerophosphodiester phosphodiesterase [Micropruina sp.]|uniref:glycerophosphodiester phosphodiesterase n=1 Tax=Micropruina sp. TaxID=2737536 RepID=UPI0039E38BDE
MSRRGLLAGGAALVASAAVGCASVQPGQAVHTWADLLADDPFYVAHRGGGRNWPEMTSYAYDQAAALPFVKALEVSFCLSADGVLVCSHEPDLSRVTGVSIQIGESAWSALAPLTVSAANTDDPAQPRRPLSRFEDVIERHIDRLVIFVEPKVSAAVEPLMSRMVALGQPERVVWKQPVNQPNFARAKQNGFATWGYVLDETSHVNRLGQFATDANIDMLGVAVTATDALTSAVTSAAAAAAAAKPVMMWPVTSVEQRARALSFGSRGLMASDIRNLPVTPL